MLDYLEHYNAIDTIALEQALTQYTKSCVEGLQNKPYRICHTTISCRGDYVDVLQHHCKLALFLL